MGKPYKRIVVSIISFTKYGASLSLEFKDILIKHNCDVKLYTGKSGVSYNDIEIINCSLREWTGIHFEEDDIIIFTGACGIAVRSIAPFINSKCTDPAVLVADDMGINIISLLSGHLGRANEWTKILASGLNANAVITTSSDIHNKIAIDLFAEWNNLYIENMEAARRIQAAVIEGSPVTVFCNAEITGKVPDNLITCLKDGDATGRKEYEDSFYINATSKYKPQVVDKDLKILNPDELYNGCLGRVSINFYPYNHKDSGNCGISCELLNLQKLKDGEKIVNRASAVDDFSVVDDGILV